MLRDLIFNEDGVEALFRKGYLKIVADREFYEEVNLDDIFDEPDMTPEEALALTESEFVEYFSQISIGKKNAIVDVALEKGFPYHVQSIVSKTMGKDLAKIKAIRDDAKAKPKTEKE